MNNPLFLISAIGILIAAVGLRSLIQRMLKTKTVLVSLGILTILALLVVLPLQLYQTWQDLERVKKALATQTLQYDHLKVLTDTRPDCDLDRRLLSLQTEIQLLRLGIRGIAASCKGD